VFVEGQNQEIPAGSVRIGEFSRRVGVPPETLRAWEERYGLVRPRRSEGGFRLYSPADARVVESMQRHLQAGLPASEAARLARDTACHLPPAIAEGDDAALRRLSEALSRALRGFDAAGAHTALDELFRSFDPDVVLRDCVVELLRGLEDECRRGDASPAQQHFCARLLETRLLAMAGGWELGTGPLAVTACGPDELHMVGITAFGLALRRRGWRILGLGHAASAASIAEVASVLVPDVVVLAFAATKPSEVDMRVLRNLAQTTPLAIAGRSATAGLARILRAELLEGDPVTAAADLARRRHLEWASSRAHAVSA
jgi:DNA-binding transcriptional MerR regulator